VIAQIYEIQNAREAEKCIELGVDRLGSVLLSKTDWRQAGLKDVMRVTEGTRAENSLIPLFNDPDTLCRVLDYYRPHYVHFCESPVHSDRSLMDLDSLVEIQRSIKGRFPEVGIIRSLPIPPGGLASEFPTLKIARLLEPVSDVFLTDTWLGSEPVEGYIGITGRTLDWGLATDLVRKTRIPVLLAGGLSPDNVFEAVGKVIPAGADSCTGTNARDRDGRPVRFRKDFSKVRAFVGEIRRAEAALRDQRDELSSRLQRLEAELRDREAALPAHSVRPHQLLKIEELEDEIALATSDLTRLEKAGV
jgi:phosphoribosylanthranilate isomerase